jgi:DNA-binding transcriptional regulator YdaS (Cro superfamily)
MEDLMNLEIIAAVKLFSSQSEFARIIGVKQPSVFGWMSGKTKPSAKSAIKIEKATNGALTRAEIRPDIFGSV